MLKPDPYGGVPLGVEAIPGAHALPQESPFEPQSRKAQDAYPERMLMDSPNDD